MRYNGGKNGAGVYQKIISMMPRHKVYVETFLGSGAILRNKRPSDYNFGIDLDTEVFNLFQGADIDRDVYDYFNYPGKTNFQFFTGSAIDKLKNFKSEIMNLCINISDPNQYLVYCDPPYLKSVRSCKNKLYKHEFWTEEEHEELLLILKSLPCNVMISGYESPLYNLLLDDWRKEHFTTSNRAGKKVIETVWLNFPEPLQLHDYRYLGKDYRERERIKRKKNRWTERLRNLKPQERYALLSAIEELNLSGTASPDISLPDQHQK